MQTLLKMFRSSKIIAGDRVAGKAFGSAPSWDNSCSALPSSCRTFMLKIMATPAGVSFHSRSGKAHIHTAVVCLKKRNSWQIHVWVPPNSRRPLSCLAEYPLLQFGIVSLSQHSLLLFRLLRRVAETAQEIHGIQPDACSRFQHALARQRPDLPPGFPRVRSTGTPDPDKSLPAGSCYRPLSEGHGAWCSGAVLFPVLDLARWAAESWAMISSKARS